MLDQPNTFRPAVGSQILKRACSLRSEIKSFMNMLGEEKLAQLASEIHIFVTEVRPTRRKYIYPLLNVLQVLVSRKHRRPRASKFN